MDQPEINSNAAQPSSAAMAVVVQFDPAINFTARGSGASSVYVANDRRTGKFYRFGLSEYHAVTLMDGHRSIAAIHDQLNEDGVLWTLVDVVTFVKELTEHRLAILCSIQSSTDAGPREGRAAIQGSEESQGNIAALDQKINWKGRLAKVLRFLGAVLTQRFKIADGDRIAAKLLPWCGFLFSAPATVLWTGLVCVGISVAWSNGDAFAAEIRRVFDQQLWMLMAVLWCLLKIVHECGHAVCAKSKGVRVGPMGVMFFLFAPLAYVDVTDAWKLVRRRDRVQIALAGVYCELAIGACAALVWWLAPIGFVRHLAAQIFLVAGPATLLVNANPLLRLDGYYVLSDLLEIPNLRAHGRKRLVQCCERLLFQIPLPSCQLSGWRRSFAVIHALCSVLFQIVWMTGLIFAMTIWAKGWGVFVALIAATLWGALPLLRWMHKIWTLPSTGGWLLSVYQKRMLGICMMGCMVAHYATVTTSPLARRVPVVIQFQNEQISRAPVEAFVTSVFVKCGDRVPRGTLLIELENPELVLKRDQMSDHRDMERAKTIQHRQRGEIAQARIAEQNADSLQRQLNEISQQIDSMRIIAQRDGKVTSPATDRLLGSYVRQGDELIRVSDPQEKEILVVVAEEDMQAFRNAYTAGKNSQVRLRGGVTITAGIRPLDPAASRILPHPALAVTAGGPLTVQLRDQSNTMELIKPHLRSSIPLDPLTSLAVESGQVGRMVLPDDRTLVSRCWDRLVPKE